MGFILFLSAYYVVWCSTLYLVRLNASYYPLFLSIIISVCQLIYLFRNLDKSAFAFLFVFSFIGFLIDSILMHCHLLDFHVNPWSEYTAPPWILGLWFNFSVLLLGIIPLLKRLIPFLWLIAMIGFPLAYYAGAQFSVVTFSNGLWSLLLLGCIWMFVLPGILKMFILNSDTQKG